MSKITAHDVRHLCVCPKCGSIGDDRDMPLVGSQPMHDVCAYRHLGVAGILRLPATERRKFTIGSVGPIAMRRLLEDRR